MPRKPFGLTLDLGADEPVSAPQKMRPSMLQLGGDDDSGGGGGVTKPRFRPKLRLSSGNGGAQPQVRGRPMLGRAGVGASDTADPMQQSFLLTEHKFSKGGMVIGKGGVFFESTSKSGSQLDTSGGASSSLSGNFGDGVDRLAASIGDSIDGDRADADAANDEDASTDEDSVAPCAVAATLSPRKGRQPLKIDPAELSLRKVVGRGATSRVQLALHKPSGRLLAVKIISLWDKSNRDQLLSEIQLLFQASCPCLVKFYGAYYQEGSISIALEYMDLGGLDSALPKKPSKVPEPALAHMLFQVLWGLSYLKHEHKLHRDIKPQNILVNKKGQVKLTDFGIARALDGTVANCTTFVGTHKYMSPARMRNVWSLGIMLIEFVTGEYPLANTSIMLDMMKAIEEKDPLLAIRAAPGMYSEELVSFCESCVVRDPVMRASTEALLRHPWMELHGASSVAGCIVRVRDYFEEEERYSEKCAEKDGGK